MAPPATGAVVVAAGVDGAGVTSDVDGLGRGVVDAGVLELTGAVGGSGLGRGLAGGTVDARVLDPDGAAGGCALDDGLPKGDEPVADGAIGSRPCGAAVRSAS